MEQVLLASYHGQQEHAWSQVFVEHVEGRWSRRAGTGAWSAPGDVLVDLTGYTRLTQERGDGAAAELAARLASLVRRSALATTGGR